MKPYYAPWVGKRYADAPFSGVRLLLVGESSFERDFKSQPCHLREDTRAISSGEFEPRYSGFWRYLQRSVTGVQTISAESQSAFWESVALVNLIQRPMSDKYARPQDEDYRIGAAALSAYLQQLKPEGVVVYSKTAWKPLSEELQLIPEVFPLVQNDLPARISESNRVYSSSQGESVCRFLLLRHPSSWPKLRATLWSPLTSSFMNHIKQCRLPTGEVKTHTYSDDSSPKQSIPPAEETNA